MLPPNRIDVERVAARRGNPVWLPRAAKHVLAGGKKNAPPIIGAICGFGAKIYKNVDSIIAVSLCRIRNKKFFEISDFCFQLQAVLVDF